MAAYRGFVFASFVALIAGQALAEAPTTSPRPEPRPVVARAVNTLITSPRPERREILANAFRPRPGNDLVEPRASGRLCGIAGLEGERIAPVTAAVNGCGVADPIRLRSVDGIRLSQPLVLDCSVAVALNTWVDRVLQPTFRNQVRRLDVAGGYVCRGRNGVSGAKISEHGKGRAIDISGLTFTDGTRITVEGDWNRGERGRAMKAAYRAGCGIFGTTLGPGSDGYHEDHMHFDVPSNRRSPYCR